MKKITDYAAGETLILIAVAVVVIAALMIILGCFTIVPAGHAGVADTFGVVDSNSWQPGIHLKFPWTGVTMFSGKTQKYIDYGSSDTATITALSNEGLSVSMGIAVNYHLNSDKATEVYKKVGPNYQDIVMVNPIHSVPRDIISRYDAKTLYSASQPGSPDRAKIESELYNGIQGGIDKSGVKDSIVIEQVFIREIKLPQTLMDSIASKLKMEQDIAKKKFEVDVQSMESNRMRAEAKGIADANKIIANSLTPSYLQWYAIEMMKKHQGATYFIPINSDGVYSPNMVLPIDKVFTPTDDDMYGDTSISSSDLIDGLKNTVNVSMNK
jgi:regulator of protease activity HflC (stomatin/prohibitin superfamily)